MTHISRVRLGTFPGAAALFRARFRTETIRFRSLALALALSLFLALSLIAAKPAGAQQQQQLQPHGTSQGEAANWNAIYPAHKTAKGVVSGEGLYVVLRGDTLYGIAKRFRVGERTLIQLNQLGDAGRIVTGQTLHIPLRSADAGLGIANARHVAVAVPSRLVTDPASQRQHVVQRGETAYRIATKYGIRLDDLATANGLDASYSVRLGQVLRIPAQQIAAVTPIPSLGPTPSRTVSGVRGSFSLSAPTASDSAAAAAANGVGGNTQLAQIWGPDFTPPVPAPRPPAPKNEPLRLTDAGSVFSPATSAPGIAPVAGPVPSPSPMIDGTTGAEQGQVTRVHLSGARSFTPLPAVRQGETVLLPERVSSDGANVFNWPVRGRLLSTFGPREGGIVNDGINIAARRGERVTTSLPGVVIFASDQLEKFGNLVLVQHDAEWVSAYSHLDGLIVGEGQQLQAGQVLGHVGVSGNVSRPQLHFEVRRGGKPVDPLQVLRF